MSDENQTGQPEATGLIKHIDNFARGLANGLTFGQADTIAAAAYTVFRDGGGKSNETFAAAFRRNQIEQQNETQQAYIESKDGVEAGEMLGSLRLGFGVFRLLKSGVAATSLHYREFLTRAGRAWAERRPMRSVGLLSVPMSRAMTGAMENERAASLAAMGSAGISLALNRTKHPDATGSADNQPDARPRPPTRAP